MFGIKTARDFLDKADADLAALNGDFANSGKAMNAILSAYHIHEWVWARHLKPAGPIKIGGVLIRSKDDFIEWLDRACPHFSLVQDLANGSKHCSPVIESTEAVAGYGQGPYGVGPYGAPYLLIDLGDDKTPEKRWAVAHKMLDDVMSFWREFCDKQAVR